MYRLGMTRATLKKRASKIDERGGDARWWSGCLEPGSVRHPFVGGMMDTMEFYMSLL